VVDAWQRRGVGTALVEQLLHQCLNAGISVLHAEVLADNKASQALIRRAFGATICGVLDAGVLHYRLPVASRISSEAALLTA
jgi:RimJ/RimL family protein N-acetyltransferase